MKLQIKNKIFSLGEGSKVLCEDGKDAFKVDGKVFTVTKKKFIKDLNGNLLYIVRNKCWTFFIKRAYVLDANEKVIVTVSRKISIKSDFTIEGNGFKMAVSGDFFGFNYDILRDGVAIAHVHRKLFSVNDAFEVEVFSDKDASFVTALVIAIDNICDKERED